MAGGSLLYAVLAVVLGVMVRKQSKGATISAIVVTSLVLAYLAVNAIGGLFQKQGLIGECVIVPSLAIGIWQLIWLIGALRSNASLAAMQGQSQMQMQYWQMMQMQQQQQQQHYQQMMQQAAASQQPPAAPQPPQDQANRDNPPPPPAT